MPSYFYKARDAQGQPHEGVQVAASEEEVVRALERAQLVPIDIVSRAAEREAGMARASSALEGYIQRQRGRAKALSVALFTRQLATMVGAGLPVVRSLHSISKDIQDKKLARVLGQVAESVQRGDALSAAMARHPGSFDQVIVSLVQTGEVSGTLDRILDQTATYLERAESLRMRVRAALRYPLFVFFFMGFVLAAMLIKIVPMFSEIYARFRVPLPLPTQVLVVASKLVLDNILLAGLAVALVIGGINYAISTDSGRLALDRVKFNLPLFGSLIRMYSISKFARGLGILTAAGTQILHALKVIRPVPGNKVVERGIDKVRAQVEEGSSLARAMTEAGDFPEMLVQMTATGEETGKLDIMLTRTADYYEQRVTAAVDGLSSLIEPVAIVLLGGMVGIMLLALYLPIFNLGQAMRAGLGTP
jgi:type IV pilus assembly protein PilC